MEQAEASTGASLVFFHGGLQPGFRPGGNKWWVEVSKMVKHSGLSVENCGSNGGSAVKQLQTNGGTLQ